MGNPFHEPVLRTTAVLIVITVYPNAKIIMEGTSTSMYRIKKRKRQWQ